MSAPLMSYVLTGAHVLDALLGRVVPNPYGR